MSLKIKKISLNILLFILLFNLIFPQSVFANDEVFFECENLKAAISQIIGENTITISDMKNFKGKLDLSYNNITCIVGLEHLKNVEHLILSFNNISDITPILKLDNLKSLYINNNWIKSLPDTKTNLISLEHLDISNNEIEWIPTEFMDMPSLKRLYMGNLMLDAAPDLSAVKDTLDRLDVSGTHFMGHEFVERLLNLELLIMNDCLMPILPDLSKMVNLSYLYFTHNDVKELPEYLGDLSLIRLDFSFNEVQSLPKSFGKLKDLEQLVFTGNYFRILPDIVTKMKSLEVLMCGQNIIEDVPQNLSELENIKRASFASNNLTSLEKFVDFHIPYSYQTSFDLNYLDLENEKNAGILKEYRNSGGIQRENKLIANVTKADIDGVTIKCELDTEELKLLGDSIRYYELRLYEIYDNGLLLRKKESLIDVQNTNLEITDELANQGNYNYLVCLVMEDTSWLPKLIKYTKTLHNVEVVATPVPQITISQAPTKTATTPLSTLPKEDIKNDENYLLYILLFGVIIIISAGVLYKYMKNKNTAKKRRR